MTSFKVVDSWVAEFPDHKWFGGTDEDRTNAISGVREQARSNGCSSFAIFSIPDTMFPLYHNTKKRVHTEQLDTGPAFTMTYVHRIEVNRERWGSLGEQGRKKLLKTVLDIVAIKGHTNPGTYEIYYLTGEGLREYIERGDVA